MNKSNKEIWNDIANGAHLVVSVSGGKDSDCMSLILHRKWRKLPNDTRGLFALIHADVVNCEWPQSWTHCQLMAQRLAVPIFKVAATYRDGSPKTFFSEVLRKMKKRPDAPPWPSAACRWCTSDLKRGPISKWIRNYFPRDAVVYSAIGLRAEESPARAKKPILRLRPSCQAPTKNRIVYDWLPLLDLTLDGVWRVLLPDGGLDQLEAYRNIYNRTGIIELSYHYHFAYVWGNKRVSCACCVLACENDLRIGIAHNPHIRNKIALLEQKSGFTFLPKKSIMEI